MRHVQGQLFETGAGLGPTQLNRAIDDVQRALDDRVDQRYVRSTAVFTLGDLSEADAAAYHVLKFTPPYALHLDTVRAYIDLTSFTGSAFVLTISATGITGWKDIVVTDDDLTLGTIFVATLQRDMRVAASQAVVITATVTTASAYQFAKLDVELGVVCDRHQGSRPAVELDAFQVAGDTVAADIAGVTTTQAAAESDDDSAGNTRLVRMFVLDFGKDFTLAAGVNDEMHIWPSAKKGIEMLRAALHAYTTTGTCQVIIEDEAPPSTFLTMQQTSNAALGTVEDVDGSGDFITSADEDDDTKAWIARMTAPAGILVERAYVVVYVGE